MSDQQLNQQRQEIIDRNRTERLDTQAKAQQLADQRNAARR